MPYIPWTQNLHPAVPRVGNLYLKPLWAWHMVMWSMQLNNTIYASDLRDNVETMTTMSTIFKRTEKSPFWT